MGSPVVLGLKKAELLLDAVDALPDGQLERGGLLALRRNIFSPEGNPKTRQGTRGGRSCPRHIIRANNMILMSDGEIMQILLLLLHP